MSYVLIIDKKGKLIMKITRKILGILGVAAVSWPTASPTVDLPVFYRTPFFCGEVQHKVTDWSTKIMVRYGQGSTWDSINGQSKKRALFNGVGPLDIVRLGFGTNIDQTTQPITYQYWGHGNNTAHPLFNNSPQPLPTNNDGKISLHGKCDVQDIGIELTQTAKYGFFGQIYAPVRSVKINHVSYKNLGSQTFAGMPNMEVFLQPDGDFNTVLAEHDIHPFTKSFKKTGITDVTAALGWHGYTKINSDIIKNLGGDMQLGVLLPLSGDLDRSYVAAIPLGYRKNIGALARVNGEVDVLDWISAGASGNVILFFDKKQELQMRTYDAGTPAGGIQSGWLRLGSGFATVNMGTIWGFGAYVRIKPFIKGVSLFCGYSFTREEKIELTVKDSNFSVMLTLVPPDTSGVPAVLTASTHGDDQNEVVRTDPRLRPWEMHVLHCGATIEFGESKAIFSPRLQVEYNYPFDANATFKTPMTAGTAGLQFSLGF